MDASLMSSDESLDDWLGSEGICLNEDALLGLPNLLDQRVLSASLGREVYLDGGITRKD